MSLPKLDVVMAEARPALDANARRFVAIAKAALRSFSRRGGGLLAGAVAFYCLLSIIPVLFIAVYLASLGAVEGPAREALLEELARWIGRNGAGTVADLLGRGGSGGSLIATRVLQAGVVVYMSTRLFTQLRRSINHLWGVELLPGDGMKATLLKQAQKIIASVFMVLLIEVILLALVGVKTAMTVATARFGPAFHDSALWHAGEVILSFAVVTLLFATMFRVLPDARIAWRDLWVGALVTALLFSLGATLISLYLSHKSARDTFGDGGAIVMLLLWVNYSARIFFVGVSFTGVWAERKGRGIHPAVGARRVA